MLRKLNPTAIACLIFLITAAQATAAFNNYSMVFDGTNEYIGLGTAGLDPDYITISAWVKLISYPSGGYPDDVFNVVIKYYTYYFTIDNNGKNKSISLWNIYAWMAYRDKCSRIRNMETYSNDI